MAGFEIRCNLPDHPDWWPSFWLIHLGCWEEIDIFEVFYDNANKLTHTIHASDGMLNGAVVCDTSFKNELRHSHPGGSGFRTQFHTVTLDWTPFEIKFYYDGVLTWSKSRYYSIAGSPLPCGTNYAAGPYLEDLSFPTKSMYLTSGVGVDDDPDVAPLTSQMEIDYIRVWQRTPNERYTDCNLRTLTGPQTLCDTATYRVGGENLQVVWECGPGAQIISQSGAQALIDALPNYTGWCTIKAKASSEYCAYKEFTKTVWIGKPQKPVVETSPIGNPVVSLAPQQTMTAIMTEFVGASPGASVWAAYGSLTRIGPTQGLQTLYKAGNAGNGTFYVYTHNACGQSPIRYGDISIQQGGGFFSLSPNPADEYISLLGDASALEDIVAVSLVTPAGETTPLPVQKSNRGDSGQIMISTRNIAEGLYELSIQLRSGETEHHLIRISHE